MTTDYQAIIDKYYPASGDNSLMREIYMKHACQVADMAVALNEAARPDSMPIWYAVRLCSTI